MQFIDSHSHLDFSDFDSDREQAIANANKAGVSNIIVSAITEKRWPLLKNVTENPCCHAAYGLHPMFMAEHNNKDIDALRHWIEKENVIAVGEIGLDFFIDDCNPEEQITLFIAQLEIASEYDLPVIIHARKSLDIVLKQLRHFKTLQGSIHSFSGSEQQAMQLIDLGFYLGFGGPITYTRATRLRSLVNNLPLESILLETDSPDQADAAHYDERNEHAYLPIIAKTIAELKSIEVGEVARVTTQNALTLFNLKTTHENI